MTKNRRTAHNSGICCTTTQKPLNTRFKKTLPSNKRLLLIGLDKATWDRNNCCRMFAVFPKNINKPNRVISTNAALQTDYLYLPSGCSL